VLAVMCLLALITYIDRVCISRLSGAISGDLGLDPVQMSWVFGAFTLGYSLLEIPAGWWGDVAGPRSVLTRIVLCWSVFTALTGAVADIPLGGGLVLSAYVQLLFVRFCFGAGEAGAFPNITRGLASWFPFSRRGFCQGLLWACGRLGGAVAPVLVGLAAAGVSAVAPGVPVWRTCFVVFSLLGVAWCAFFWPWYRDRPADKAGVNRAELDLIQRDRPVAAVAGHGGIPWGRLVSDPNLYLLCLAYFLTSYAWYVYITFLPKFLTGGLGLPEKDGEQLVIPGLGWSVPSFDVMCGMPLFFGAVGCLLGGPLTDGLIRLTGSRRWGRSLPGAVGSVLAGIALVLAVSWESPWPVMFAIAGSSLLKDLSMASTWATSVDIGGRYSATVSGFMNMTGNLGGVVSPLVMGVMLAHFGGGSATWDAVFYMFAGVHVVTGVVWLFVDATRPVFPEDAETHPPAYAVKTQH
jgi:MFS family permease